MIPADVASRLRLVLPDQPAPTQPATPAQKLADALSDLIPGQRIMAEIQALLPNGTYRAIIAQRDVTLALPFSAKPGDSLELEVVETGGKVTLAVVANRSATAAGAADESVPTTLSQTGRLIGDLLGGIDAEGKRPAPAPLNGNQPLVSEFPEDPAALVPVLKEALSKSGMFYEAHQARWVSGNLPTETLLQEPQGKLSPAAQFPQVATADTTAKAAVPAHETAAPAAMTVTNEAGATSRGMPSPAIPPDLTPLVQQQLDALATQNFVWQGQIWPGQQMQWAIEESPGREPGGEDAAEQWRTHLKLTLPNLGTIEATLQLRRGGDIELALGADSESARQQLSSDIQGLGRRLEDSGLRLTAVKVDDGQHP